jgi:adenylate kinase
MRLVFLGPPGSGKGTQAKTLSGRLGVPMISTGEILRSAVRQSTPLGVQVKATMEAGELVPDDLMIALIRERLSGADTQRGFLLDGFPRTVAQAKELDQLLATPGLAGSGGLTAVVNLIVPEAVLVARLDSRSVQEQRADDSRSTVLERLRVYREKTAPLIGFYRNRGLLVDVDGVGEVGEIERRITEALASRDVARKTGGAVA